ncbi:MAG: hypothetical protein CBB82_03485 [Betaproteobacteria bacterium TMED22]|nr:MAG: hypothetical protein CBB82_03485 [Betaproteobacteria bacterium TMED22]|tara:strand:- start:24319 stop:25170 length:852 start_codon:yes stop_codon:yes gene_type:complete
MVLDFNYDPVKVTDEATATGRTAEIFQDIRATMRIPIVTSIWRALASWDDCLERTWDAVKPIYESGLPDLVLPEFLDQVALSGPEFQIEKRVSTHGLSGADFLDIKRIVKAYSRSNALNLLALAAYVSPPSEGSLLVPNNSNNHHATLPLKPLLSRAQITDQNWIHVCEANSLGASTPDDTFSHQAHVATLWRHLAYWPTFLSLVYEGFSPHQKTGIIDAMSLRTTTLAANIGAKISRSFNIVPTSLPDKSIEVISSYVQSPIQVARMVVMGHALSNWLGQLD